MIQTSRYSRQIKSLANTILRFNIIVYAISALIVSQRSSSTYDGKRRTGNISTSGKKPNAITLSSKGEVRNFHPRQLGLKFPIYIKGKSSGTTNSPLTVYRSLSNVVVEEYFTLRYWRKHGYRFYDKTLVLRGEDITQYTAKPFLYLPFENKILFSSYHLSPRYVGLLISLFEQHNFKYVQAYPSSANQLALLFKNHGYKPKNLKAIFTSSESWEPYDINQVESHLAPVFDHYGQAERAAALQSCPLKNYHLIEDYSEVSFERCGSDLLEICGSTIHNTAMPLKKYKTGDYVDHEPIRGCACGEQSRYVRKIIGRSDDYIYSSDGTRIGRLGVAFRDIEKIIAAQVKQNKLDEVEVACIASTTEPAALELLKNTIVSSVKRRVGSHFKVDVNFVEDIPRGANGKFKAVVSEL